MSELPEFVKSPLEKDPVPEVKKVEDPEPEPKKKLQKKMNIDMNMLTYLGGGLFLLGAYYLSQRKSAVPQTIQPIYPVYQMPEHPIQIIEPIKKTSETPQKINTQNLQPVFFTYQPPKSPWD
jgi:hypothetical protein